ncbi:MAG TPA: SDR family oxidoreductase [Archangium sp.]|uniref:SDR family NAD(P)-dependent oxidoreductase n=1 Tax=Archangium sp. TaxID=1872627 RepID=UPI002E31435C|nr:SDR family oxidoreductase [Archangium sp.]HEX5748108.1 SDR family oxidoreductase [Archangium sp.]
MRFQDKVALIIGAADNIGQGLALKFAHEGADLLLVDLDSQGMARIAARVRALGRKASELVVDMSTDGAAQRIIDTAVKESGSFHILVYNAANPEHEHFLEVSQDTLDKMIGIGLRAPFLLGSAAAKYWLQHQIRGRIVNISSINAEAIQGRASVFCAAKGGVRMLTVSAACDLGPHGITVNAVGPGYTHTDIARHPAGNPALEQDWIARTPLRRLAVPEDIANAVAFLASDEASYITGQTLYVEGGRTIHIP